MTTQCKTISRPEYMSYGIEDAKLFNQLDKKFLSLLDTYKYDEVVIPSLLEGDVLRKLGYFNSFPHYLTLASHCKTESLEAAMREKAITDTMLLEKDLYLTPAACLHIYPMLQNFTGNQAVITTLANVFRNEDFFQEGVRLWQFKVREIVFVGDKEFVVEGLDSIIKGAEALARTYDSNAELHIASDHFYNTRENRKRKTIQEKTAVKRELITSKNVSIASANYHGVHFSKTFGFDRGGSVVTGCVGFGIDRWMSMIKGEDKYE